MEIKLTESEFNTITRTSHFGRTAWKEDRNFFKEGAAVTALYDSAHSFDMRVLAIHTERHTRRTLIIFGRSENKEKEIEKKLPAQARKPAKQTRKAA